MPFELAVELWKGNLQSFSTYTDALNFYTAFRDLVVCSISSCEWAEELIQRDSFCEVLWRCRRRWPAADIEDVAGVLAQRWHVITREE